MPGMLTPQQMEALRKAKGAEFDHLFLMGMIQHHNGALTMVKDLFDTAGAGQDAELFNFATDADNTQRAEITNYGDHVEERDITRRNDEPIAQSCAVCDGCAAYFLFRSEPNAGAGGSARGSAAGTATEARDTSGRIRMRKRPKEENPFAPQPAPALPPGMTGSDANDPRSKLTPGMYDAGEAAMGMKHLLLLKKPDAFQLGSTDPDDPKVQKTIVGQLGMGDNRKMPKPMQLVIAQLAFANSDLAFQGTHLFQGNFYGVNIYDISNPANDQLLTSMVCPGGQGDVSVYKNLLFMSVEMPNGRLDCGVAGISAGTCRPRTKRRRKITPEDKRKR